MNTTAAAPRVAGWDLLRGLCALGVASYHLLYWQGLAQLHSIGSYGVYLFFVLSGASLAYTYGAGLNGARAIGGFLATRWWRLAPLYLLVCIVWVLMLGWQRGAPVDQLGLRFLLNLTFAFGVWDPVTWALPVGGWSLGIEFVYYLLFPLALWVLGRPWLAVAVGLALVWLQWGWIMRTAGSHAGYMASTVAYHQVPAFAAYFFAGCAIGLWRRTRCAGWPWPTGVLAWCLMAGLLLALNPRQAGNELLGWRGLVLPLACVAVVAVSAQVRLEGRLNALARWLGDATYGTYLLHPVLFFGWSWFVARLIPGMAQSPGAWRWAIGLGVLVLCGCLAVASERHLEAPLRRWAKRLWQRAL